MMARGGIYLGAGIAPKILPMLRDGGFMNALVQKGRMGPLPEAIPARVHPRRLKRPLDAETDTR
jgi:glucokinase